MELNFVSETDEFTISRRRTHNSTTVFVKRVGRLSVKSNNLNVAWAHIEVRVNVVGGKSSIDLVVGKESKLFGKSAESNRALAIAVKKHLVEHVYAEVLTELKEVASGISCPALTIEDVECESNN